ncbi:hypothetical protein FKW77_007896 [Venturia effusa]|uniref:Uncharacterized protein n=1 Tax=Venturia effusa TaxID=50376 RepID=A0A517LBB8_9PEZI|nr:hypothetical protein FKW77_007896 [Venturia effusa]
MGDHPLDESSTQPTPPSSKWLPTSLSFIPTESFEDYISRSIATGLITSSDITNLQANTEAWTNLASTHEAAQTVVNWSNTHGRDLETTTLQDAERLLEAADVFCEAMWLLMDQAERAEEWHVMHMMSPDDGMWLGLLYRLLLDPVVGVAWCFMAKLRLACPELMALLEEEGGEEAVSGGDVDGDGEGRGKGSCSGSRELGLWTSSAGDE